MVVSVDMVLWSDKIGMDAVEAVVEKVSDKVDKNLQAVFFAENRIFFFFFLGSRKVSLWLIELLMGLISREG